MNKILIGFLLVSINLFAVDMSVSGSKDQSYKEDKSLGYSKSMTVDKSKDTTKTKSKTKERSESESLSLTRVEQISSLVGLMALEKSGIEPFATCQILSKPKLTSDFDLSCRVGNNVNEGRCQFLENAAKSNFALDEVTYMTDEIKEYAACTALYGALIAQDMKHNKFSPELTDKELVKIFEGFEKTLDSDNCVLNGSASEIVCGSTKLVIGFEPMLIYSGISLYSDKTYYGYSSQKSKDKSKRLSDSFSMSKSKRKAQSNNLAKSLSTNTALSASLQKGSSANLSLSKFLPAD